MEDMCHWEWAAGFQREVLLSVSALYLVAVSQDVSSPQLTLNALPAYLYYHAPHSDVHRL